MSKTGITLNILVLSDLFPTPAEPYLGIFVLEQLKALRDLGVNILPVCPVPWAPHVLKTVVPRVAQCLAVPSEAQVEGFRVLYPRVAAPGGKFFSAYGYLYYVTLRHLVGKLLREHKIDVIHAHTVMPGGCAAALLSRNFKIPAVVTMHGSDVRDYPGASKTVALATRWALRNVKHHIAVSLEIAQQARMLEPVTRDIYVIHNGADNFRFRPHAKQTARSMLGIPADRKMVLWVGSLVPIKAVDILLNAFAKLASAQRECPLLYLVGQGVQLAELKAISMALGIAESVRFMGVRPYEEIPLWLSAADCLALPSRGEGLPTILPEAMMCRLPVVASAVGGVPEIIVHQKTGKLVQSEDAIGFSAAINYMLYENPSHVRRMVDSAERFAKTHLSWRANAQKTVQIYTHVLKTANKTCQSELNTSQPYGTIAVGPTA